MIHDKEVIIELSRSMQIRLAAKVWKGQELIDIRYWVKWAADGEIHPTRKGICINKQWVKERILPALIEMVKD